MATRHANASTTVILATHSDQSLALLGDADDEEASRPAAIGFQPNRATLHTDLSLLSPERRAWAAWNYDCGSTTAPDRAAVTYDLTDLQRLVGARRYLVSLNADERIDPSTVLASFDYAHPVFDRGAIEAQSSPGGQERTTQHLVLRSLDGLWLPRRRHGLSPRSRQRP